MLLQVLRLQPLQKQHPEIEEPMGQEAFSSEGNVFCSVPAVRVIYTPAVHVPWAALTEARGPPRLGPTHAPPPEAGSARRGTLAQTVGPFTRPPCFPFGLPVSAP